MSGISEKLGITPGPLDLIAVEGKYVPFYRNESLLTVVSEGDGTSFGAVYKDEDARLFSASPEMLIWIIGIMNCAENINTYAAAELLELGKELVEKATNKTWAEIKELL